MVKVRMAGPARAYLRKEAAYLRQNNPRAADAFLLRLREARDNLRRFPLMGFQKGGLPIPGLRSLVVDSYVLDYEIAGDELLITAIRPSQIPESLFEIEDDFDYEAGAPPPGPRRR